MRRVAAGDPEQRAGTGTPQGRKLA